ncbi:aldose epimerase family protein [Spirillospora sp. NPDC050679]
MTPAAPAVSREPFGTLADGSAVDRYTLTGPGIRVRVLTFGGIVQTLEVPDRDGAPANVVLGFGDLAGYDRPGPYFGAVIGRYANRIAGGRFTLDGREHRVPVNNGPNAIHGGERGFDKRVWDAEPLPDGVRLSYTSADGEEGFPGTLRATVAYTLTGDGALRVEYTATAEAATVVNLTNHGYFNLAGEGTGDVLGHRVQIDADRYTPVDPSSIPTGEIAPVAGTPFDFTRPRALGERIRDDHPQLLIAHGYDHNFVLSDRVPGTPTRAARVTEPRSGRVLEVRTTEPGVQLYTANFLDGSLVGTGGRAYRQGDAFCLETQHFPDSPNRPEFPSTVLRPGERFASTTEFAFSTEPSG